MTDAIKIRNVGFALHACLGKVYTYYKRNGKEVSIVDA